MEEKPRIFIHLVTGDRFRMHHADEILAEERSTGKPPFRKGSTIAAIYEDGPKKGQYAELNGYYLEEEVPLLEQMLRYQADHLEDTRDAKWNRFGYEDEEEPVLMINFNPYLRDEAYLKEYEERRAINKEGYLRVFYHLGNFNDLSRQNADLVALWLEASGFDLRAMKSLGQTNRHFARIMRNNNIWRKALVYHFGQLAVRNMAMSSVPDIHVWVKNCLDITTIDANKRGDRYFKRFFELIMRLARTQVPSETLRQTPRFLNSGMGVFPICIWQCKEHIYGLFSSQARVGKVYRGETLVYWDARSEDPFDQRQQEDRRPYRLNLIGPNETFEYVYHDQDGFICRINDKLVYTFADYPHGKYKATYRVKRSSYEQNINMTVLPIRSEKAWLMPECICLETAIIPRSRNHELGAPILLEQGFRIGAVVDHHSILVGQADPERPGKKIVYRVNDPIQHSRLDETWTRFRDPSRHQTVRINESQRVFSLLCHYRYDSRKMEWHNYRYINDESMNNAWQVWQRQRLENLDLTSAPICDNCQIATAVSECGNGCGKSVYCGQSCADAHYEKHKCFLE